MAGDPEDELDQVRGQQGLGVEYSVTLAGALICLMFTGGGEWSIDGQRLHSRAARAAGRARLRGKM